MKKNTVIILFVLHITTHFNVIRNLIHCFKHGYRRIKYQVKYYKFISKIDVDIIHIFSFHYWIRISFSLIYEKQKTIIHDVDKSWFGKRKHDMRFQLIVILYLQVRAE